MVGFLPSELLQPLDQMCFCIFPPALLLAFVLWLFSKENALSFISKIEGSSENNRRRRKRRKIDDLRQFWTEAESVLTLVLLWGILGAATHPVMAETNSFSLTNDRIAGPLRGLTSLNSLPHEDRGHGQHSPDKPFLQDRAKVVLSVTQFQEKSLSIYQQLGSPIFRERPGAGLMPLTRALASHLPSSEVLKKWEEQIPYIAAAAQILRTSCKLSNLKTAGDPDLPESFPNCLHNYLYDVKTRSVRLELGQKLRKFMLSTAEMSRVLGRKKGVCIGLSFFVGSTDEPCRALDLLIINLPRFIKEAEGGTKKKHSGSAAQLDSQEVLNDVLSLPKSTLGKAKNEAVLLASLTFKKSFKLLALDPLREEADTILRNRHTEDPIHKWRYAAGIVHFYTFLSIWVAQHI